MNKSALTTVGRRFLKSSCKRECTESLCLKIEFNHLKKIKMNLRRAGFVICLLMLVFSGCDRNLSECSSIDCRTGVSISFKISNYEEREIVDSLIKVRTRRSEMYGPEVGYSNSENLYIEVAENDKIEIYYKDSLKVSVSVDVFQLPGECCGIYKAANIKINGEMKCSTDCDNQIFDIEL